jgi:hypothetical protein
MKFGAAADELFLSPCRKILAKLGGCTSISNVNDDAGCHATTSLLSSPTFVKSTHAFSGRLDPETTAASSSSTSCSGGEEWDVALQLTSMGTSSPNVLVGLGPRNTQSASLLVRDGAADEVPTAESQQMFEGRVLSTPLIWEEPGFVCMECSDRGVRLWSDAMGWFGTPPHTAVAAEEGGRTNTAGPSCFQYSNERERWEADVRVTWNSSLPVNVGARSAGRFEFFVGSSAGALSEWTSVATGHYPVPLEEQPSCRYGAVAPYVTLLNHVPSEARVL